MSSSPAVPISSSSGAPRGTNTSEKSYFEQQRAHLCSEIALAMEHVLMNMNTLNRNLESVIAVGREFESVEALWSQFESVMGRNPGVSRAEDQEQQGGAAGEGEDEEEEEGDTTMQG